MSFPAKILIVDDEPHVRAFLAKLAQAHLGAAAVFESSDAVSALESFQRERPDLVLLDTDLIGASGLEVLSQIRALDDDVVVIMLSSVSAMGAIQAAVDRGANGYVLKNTGSEKVAQSLLEAVAQSFGDEDAAAGEL